MLRWNPIRAVLAETPETAERTTTSARRQDRQTGNPDLPSSGWLSPVHVDGDGYDDAASVEQGCAGHLVLEHLELQGALAWLRRVVELDLMAQMFAEARRRG